MAALHGPVEEYDSEREQWTSYTERLEFYFAANDVSSPEKQRAILLSACQPSTYQLIRSLVAPAKPSSKTFVELVALVKTHFNPKPSAIVRGFKFTACVRNQGESVSSFVARLWQLTEHCSYGTALEEMLRDRIVRGVNDERLQRRLLAEPELTFTKAVDLAQAYESAAKDAKDLQPPKPPGDILALRANDRDKPPQGTATRGCYRCGGQHHQSKCGFCTSVCHYCGKRGHVAKVCRSRLNGLPPIKGKPQSTHLVSEVEPDAYTLFAITSSNSAPIYATVKINETELTLQVDTGASHSLISEATYSDLQKQEKVPACSPSRVKLRTYSGESLEVLGQLTVNVCYKNQQQRLPLVVVQGNGPSLLGRDWLSTLRLDWRELHQVTSTTSGYLQEPPRGPLQGGTGHNSRHHRQNLR